MNKPNIGRFASATIRQEGEYTIGQPLVGLRFDHLHIRILKTEYFDPIIQEWMQHTVFCRVKDANDYKITIELVPG